MSFVEIDPARLVLEALEREEVNYAVFGAVALRCVWALHSRTLQPRFPPGAYRHRSLKEMNELQERWDEANFLAHRRRLDKMPPPSPLTR